MGVGSRLKHAYNAFLDRDQVESVAPYSGQRNTELAWGTRRIRFEQRFGFSGDRSITPRSTSNGDGLGVGRPATRQAGRAGPVRRRHQERDAQLPEHRGKHRPVGSSIFTGPLHVALRGRPHRNPASRHVVGSPMNGVCSIFESLRVGMWCSGTPASSRGGVQRPNWSS